MNKQDYENSVLWWVVLILVCIGLWINDHPQQIADAIEFLRSL